MKNITNILFALLFIVGTSSCLEEQLLTDYVSEGANIAVSGTSSFLNGETSEVTITVDFMETDNAQISEVKVTKQLITAAGSSEVVSEGPITEEGDLVISTADLFANVPVNGTVLTEDDLSPGDSWLFTFKIEMMNGEELTPLGNSEWSINFSCPSDIAGTYNSVASGATGDGAGGDDAPYNGLASTVEITATGTDGVYMVDDLSFGLYPVGYGDTAPPGRIRDICNSISDLGDTDQYGDPFTVEGTVNADGTIDLEWSNTYGDRGTVVLTPAS